MYPIVKDTIELLNKAKTCKTHEARVRAANQAKANIESMNAKAIRQLAKAQA